MSQLIQQRDKLQNDETGCHKITKPSSVLDYTMIVLQGYPLFFRQRLGHLPSPKLLYLIFTNSVRTSQETYYVSATKPNRLILRINGFSDFVHRPDSKELEDTKT
jgi:hypothetical protein